MQVKADKRFSTVVGKHVENLNPISLKSLYKPFRPKLSPHSSQKPYFYPQLSTSFPQLGLLNYLVFRLQLNPVC